MNVHQIYSYIKALPRPGNKRDFLNTIRDGAAVLDVGCGNNSVLRIKALKPNVEYTGVDIGDYNQSESAKKMCHRYVLTTDEGFTDTIRNLGEVYDYVICTHNLEHCADPYGTLSACLACVAPGGSIFIATPAKETVGFPHRRGTLNFTDDTTHRTLIDPDRVQAELSANNFEAVKYFRRYQPLAMSALGLLTEPVSAILKKNLYGTWELYGFETIFWARKR